MQKKKTTKSKRAQVFVRVTPEQRELFETLAREENRTLSGWCLDRLLKAAEMKALGGAPIS